MSRASSPTPNEGLVALLRNQHSALAAAFDSFQKATAPPEKQHLANALMRDCLIGMIAEESTLYPFMASLNSELATIAKKAQAEHDQAKQDLAAISKIKDINSAEFDAAIKKAWDNLLAHMVNAESANGFLAKVELLASKGQLNDLATRFLDKKKWVTENVSLMGNA